MNWRDVILRLARVPPTPAPPPGSPPRLFRAAPNYYYLRLIRWGSAQLLAIFGLLWAIYFVSWVASTKAPKQLVWLLTAGEVFGWTVLVVEVLLGWMVVRLNFELRWYMLSDRAIRIREGITTVREKTVALANIQNIAVRQGPLQRLLGIADVEVKTAGGGGGSSQSDGEHGKGLGEPMHVAYFRGVANAEEIRDLLREGVRRQRDSGLGDPDDAAPETGDVHEAAAALLDEARRLRRAVGMGSPAPPLTPPA